MSCDLKLHEDQYLPYFMLSLHMSFLSRSAVIEGSMVDLKLQHSANFKKDMKIPTNCYNTNTKHDNYMSGSGIVNAMLQVRIDRIALWPLEVRHNKMIHDFCCQLFYFCSFKWLTCHAMALVSLTES